MTLGRLLLGPALALMAAPALAQERSVNVPAGTVEDVALSHEPALRKEVGRKLPLVRVPVELEVQPAFTG